MNRILLIDDDPELVRGLCHRLEAEGYVVRTARNGMTGMRLADQEDHDLILVDAAAPELDGYELLERLRKRGNTTPVILLGARDAPDIEEDRIRGLRLGADDYVARPVGHGELLARIRARTHAARRIAVLNGALSGDGLTNLVDKALELTRAERGIVLLRNGSPKLRVVVARGPDGKALPRDVKYSTSVARHVMDTGEAEVLIDPADAKPDGSVVELRLRQVLCAPLESGGQRVGVLYADSRFSNTGFTQADLDVFNSLARQCSKVIAKRRMEDSLREARDLQRALVPGRPKSGPHFQVAGLNRPLEEAGGDYLDYIRLGEDRLAIAVGDVAGHGVRAALMMTAARSLLRAFLPHERDAAAVLFRLNRSGAAAARCDGRVRGACRNGRGPGRRGAGRVPDGRDRADGRRRRAAGLHRRTHRGRRRGARDVRSRPPQADREGAQGPLGA